LPKATLDSKRPGDDPSRSGEAVPNSVSLRDAGWTRTWATLTGVALSMVISGALVIATAKAGISPGVSPLVVLLGWVLLGRLRGATLKPFLATLQVAGSGGAAVSAGLIFTAPILQITARLMKQPVPEVDVVTTMVACVSGALMGWGFVGLAANRFLADPRLPAPEAVACDRLIHTAVDHPDRRPRLSTSLLAAMSSAFIVRLLTFLGWCGESVASAKLAIFGGSGVGALKLSVPISPLFLGIGALLTFPTAVLILSGGMINALTKSIAARNGLPDETYRWVGGAAMVVAVLYSLLVYLKDTFYPIVHDAKIEKKIAAPPPASSTGSPLPVAMKVLLSSGILAGAVLLVLLLSRSEITFTSQAVLTVVALVSVSLLSGLGGLLSLQIGASASPVSGTVFMAMLVLSLTSLSLSLSGFIAVVTLQPVLVACCVAIAAANDSSQDYKTLSLNGYAIHEGYLPQLAGCMAGAVTVPFSLWVAHEAFGLGSEQLPCPQASFFATVLTSLFDPLAGIPWTPVGAGLILGLVAVSIEALGKRRDVLLSSLALAVGIYLPAEMGIGILLGNLARVIGSRSLGGGSHSGILTAAGLISGDALLSLLAGAAIVSRFDLSAFDQRYQVPAAGTAAMFLAMWILLYLNHRRASSPA